MTEKFSYSPVNVRCCHTYSVKFHCSCSSVWSFWSFTSFSVIFLRSCWFGQMIYPHKKAFSKIWKYGTLSIYHRLQKTSKKVKQGYQLFAAILKLFFGIIGGGVRGFAKLRKHLLFQGCILFSHILHSVEVNDFKNFSVVPWF